MGCLCCAGWKKKQAADGFYYIDRLPLSLSTLTPFVFVSRLHRLCSFWISTVTLFDLLAAQPWHLVLWIFALGNFAVSWCERKASNAILRSLVVIVCFIRSSNAPGVSRKDYNLRIDICQAIQIFFFTIDSSPKQSWKISSHTLNYCLSSSPVNRSHIAETALENRSTDYATSLAPLSTSCTHSLTSTSTFTGRVSPDHPPKLSRPSIELERFPYKTNNFEQATIR